LAVGGPSKGVIAKAQERGLIVIGDQPDISPTTAVTPIGATFGNVGFATKRDATGPAIARLGVQLRGVNEGGHT
jgi:hypothetical protein